MSSIEKLMEKMNKEKDGEKNVIGSSSLEEHSRFRPTNQNILAVGSEQLVDFEALKELGAITLDEPRSQIAEEYRSIKRPLLKNAFDSSFQTIENANLIMVTSAFPGEGKSFSSINLAMSIVMELDYTVLLVEADFAKPKIIQYMGMPQACSQRGLINYLVDDSIKLESLLIRTNIPKLSVLSAGKGDANTSELLSSMKMRNFVADLSARYPDRIVIFDSPPLLLSNDAVALSNLVGQVVLVIESGRTEQKIVKEAVKLVDDNKFMGVLLNKQRGSGSSGYGYGYGYYGS